jgi:TrmH RNA methyltransferase
MTKPPRRFDTPTTISNQNNHPFDNKDPNNRQRAARQFRRRQPGGYGIQQPSPYGDLPQQQNISSPKPRSDQPYREAGSRDTGRDPNRNNANRDGARPYNQERNRGAYQGAKQGYNQDRNRGPNQERNPNQDRSRAPNQERSRTSNQERNFDENSQPHKSYNREDEQKIYGEHACMAAFKHRPDAIVRLYLNQETARRHGPLMSFLASQRKAYKVIKDDELARVSATQHHGGMVMVVKKNAALTLDDLFLETADKESCCILALDRVGNPHNLGAILRSAAHFGATHVIASNSSALTNGSCARTAEGAAELIRVVECEFLEEALDMLQDRGYSVITTSSHNGDDIYDIDFPAKSVIVLGEEGKGISEEIIASSDQKLKIGGTGLVESLNVSVAAGLILGEWWRQHGTYDAVEVEAP